MDENSCQKNDNEEIEDVEKGLVLLKEVENRHKDLLFVRDKILRIYETWSNLNKFAFEIQKTHNHIIEDLKVSLNYLSQANIDTKESFIEIRRKRNYCILLTLSVIIIILAGVLIIIVSLK
jgi:t-SNARE complex subunit (syntaxin)